MLKKEEQRIITESLIEEYREFLHHEEKADSTIQKYICDIRKLMNFIGKDCVNKDKILEYRNYLQSEKGYEVRSINSYIVAQNRFFEYLGWYELRVKTLKLQEEVFMEENQELTREDYNNLVKTARSVGNERLALIITAICSTGIRVSELSSITVASLERGYAKVNNKGKVRKVLLPAKLRTQLLSYVAEQGIEKGVVFCTKSGREVSRNNVWRDMKNLCKKAGMPAEKVFPHNLRRLFARTYYENKKDIAKLANILGHSSIETTRIYLRCSSAEYLKDLDEMELVI